MHDELTEVDIRKMKEELEYREKVLQPKILEDVKVARGFGDLSENFEYKSAKQEKIKNESRMRYLRNMIHTAVVISAAPQGDGVNLFDTVEVWFEEDEEAQEVTIVTTLRQNALNGIISNKSPLGKALLGHKVGERVKVEVSEDYSYYVEIRSIRKGKDDDSLDISSF